MGLKRMSGLSRSYRFQRSFSNGAATRVNGGDTRVEDGGGSNAVHVTSITDTSSPSSPPSSSSPLRSGDVILNTEGVKVGWMLDGGRSPSSAPLFSPYSRSLPCTPCVQQSYPQYWTIGRFASYIHNTVFLHVLGTIWFLFGWY